MKCLDAVIIILLPMLQNDANIGRIKYYIIFDNNEQQEQEEVPLRHFRIDQCKNNEIAQDNSVVFSILRG